VPVVFTFTVVGSTKTLEFLTWLGVDVPRWIQNELRHSADPLVASAEQAYEAARDLIAFSRSLGMPFGINVESVSIRRAEIDEAVSLARRLRQHLHR
jgi:regulator of protease activity HflC (stomatin/prohibitin superfamily)